jgi:hypothetical protein
VIAHLKARGVPGLFWFHIPNGGKRPELDGAILQGLGVKRGVPDLCLLHKGQAYFLELKAEKGVLSPEQVKTMHYIWLAGHAVEVAYGLDNALAILEGWRLLKGSSGYLPLMAPVMTNHS